MHEQLRAKEALERTGKKEFGSGRVYGGAGVCLHLLSPYYALGSVLITLCAYSI